MSAFLMVLISGALLIAFSVLFQIEANRGGRLILSGFRTWLDRCVLSAHHYLLHARAYVGSGSLRIIFHYYINAFLGMLLSCADLIRSHLTWLQRRNKTIVREVREVQKRSHLELIAAHKASNALSDSERKELKDRAIEG